MERETIKNILISAKNRYINNGYQGICYPIIFELSSLTKNPSSRDIIKYIPEFMDICKKYEANISKTYYWDTNTFYGNNKKSENNPRIKVFNELIKLYS